jgi:hypothetical protein
MSSSQDVFPQLETGAYHTVFMDTDTTFVHWYRENRGVSFHA